MNQDSSGPMLASSNDCIRILDDSGCLTAEAMCFAEELGPEQRAVVDRHVRTCALCAHQQASLAQAAQRVRRGRPRVTVPADARIAARQAVLRSLMLRRNKQPARAVAEKRTPPRRLARRRLWLLASLASLVALGSALAVWLCC